MSDTNVTVESGNTGIGSSGTVSSEPTPETTTSTPTQTTSTAQMQLIQKSQNEYQRIYLETSSDIIRRPNSEKGVEASLQSLEAEVASLKQQLADLTNGNEVGY